ncbi:ATP-dependent zinc metalloprotease FtsH, partial [human gut metagenome]
ELATQLLEKETLLEKDLERIFAPVVKQGERPLWRSDESLVLEGDLAAGTYFSGSCLPRRRAVGDDAAASPAEAPAAGEVAEPAAPVDGGEA